MLPQNATPFSATVLIKKKHDNIDPLCFWLFCCCLESIVCRILDVTQYRFSSVKLIQTVDFNHINPKRCFRTILLKNVSRFFKSQTCSAVLCRMGKFSMMI